MIVTTTPGIDGKSIAAYHGVVVGEAILGANIFRDVFAGIRDIGPGCGFYSGGPNLHDLPANQDHTACERPYDNGFGRPRC